MAFIVFLSGCLKQPEDSVLSVRRLRCINTGDSGVRAIEDFGLNISRLGSDLCQWCDVRVPGPKYC